MLLACSVGGISDLLSLDASALYTAGAMVGELSFPRAALGWLLAVCAVLGAARLLRTLSTPGAWAIRHTRCRALEERDQDPDDEWRQTLLNAIPSAVLSINEQGVIESQNSQAARIFGYSDGELLGQNVRVLIPEPSRQTLDVDRGACLEIDVKTLVSSTGEVAAVRKDGSPVTIDLRVVETVSGGRRVFIAVISDLSGREHSSQLINIQRSALEAAANGIVITDRDSVIIWVNDAFCCMTGYSADEVVGRRTRTLKSGAHDRAFYTNLWNTVLAGRVWQGEMVNRKKDGSLYSEEMTITPIKTDDGLVTHFVAIKLDISERKRHEQELNRAREDAEVAAEAKSAFLATMSHEIRTPMNGVLGMNGLLLDTELTAEQRDFAETVRDSAEALLTVINDILDFSKVEAGKMDLEAIDFDLRSAIEQVGSLLAESAHRKELELLHVLPADMPKLVRGDPGRLRQILVNLAGNAIKFTDSGEVSIRVVIEGQDDSSIDLRFDVQDTGIGISQQAKPHVFESFTQADGSMSRQYGGTGLGLAIAKQLVELMGGEIGLESEAGRGSRFWFSVRFEKPLSAPVEESVACGDLRGVRALVVDDNQTNRRILVHQLSQWGIEVKSVDGGEAALEALTSGFLTGAPFDIAIIDMQMPGMDGAALTERIKQDPGLFPMPIVMLSSVGFPDQLARARQAGVTTSLTKPVRQALLREVLESALRQTDLRSTALPAPSGGTVRAPDVPHASSLAGARILVVEDNIINQKVTVQQLSKLGYVADVAANGLEAVEAVGRIGYAAILMDCQMPEMDGFAATAEIRRLEGNQRHTLIIALTANAMKGDRERTFRAGMDDYLSKPVRQQDLGDILERWLIPEAHLCSG